MKLTIPWSLISTKVAELLGYLLPPRAFCFQTPGGLPLVPSPELSRVRNHPPTNAASPSEYILLGTRSKLSTFRGVSLPFATSACAVHLTSGFPRPKTFHPQRFTRSRRLTPAHTSWAYFIPQPRPGFALQGLSSLLSRLASSTSRPLMPLARSTSQQTSY